MMDTMKEHRIITPLNSTFMLVSIVGFLTSVFYVPSLAQQGLPYAVDFAFAFGMVFFLMFISSLISMHSSPVSGHLQIDEKRRIRL